ncbi:MAG: AsmA-like C-terminal region-containing protein [Alphaproteobacteria bacterium]
MAACATGLLVLTGLLAWRLSQGPVALDFLVPPIERALSRPERGLFVRVDSVMVDSVGFLQFRAEGVRVIDRAGVSVAGTPHLRLVLSSRALARGMLAAREIELAGVRVRLARAESGSVQLGFDDSVVSAPGDDEDMEWVAADLIQPPDPTRPSGYLERVRVAEADVLVRDARLKRSWRIPHAEFELLRSAVGVSVAVSGVLDVDGRPQRSELHGHLDLETGTAQVRLGLSEVRPDLVTQILPVLGLLGAFNAPISGDLAFRLSRRGDIEHADVRLEAAAGSIGLPMTAAAIPVDAMTLRGTMTDIGHFSVESFVLEAAGQRIAASGDLRWSQEGSRAGLRFEGVRPSLAAALVPEFAPAAGIDLPLDGWVEVFMQAGAMPETVAFGLRSDGGSVSLPGLLPVPVAVSGLELRAAADLTAGRLRVERFSLGLGGPRIEGDANLQTLHGGAVLQADLGVHDVPTDDLGRLWPEGVAPGARRWVLAHLSGGGVPEAKARVAMVLSGEGPAVPMASVTGEMRIRDVTAVYWDPMPAFEGIDATATFTEDRFDLRLERGRYRNIQVRGGDLAFTELADPRTLERADIRVELDGPLSEIVAVLDRPPLGYAAWLGVEPEQIGGRGAAGLRVRLPLLDDVSFEQVDLTATATLADVRWPDAALGQALERGDLKLRIDKDTMSLSGEGFLAGAPVRLELEEVFAGGTHLSASAVVDETARRRLGYDTAPWLTGAVPVRVRMDGTRARSDIVATLDLTPAALAVPEAGWAKPAGRPGEAEVALVLADERLAGIPRFSLRAPGAAVDGRAELDPATGRPLAIDVPRLRLGPRTDLSLSVASTVGGGYRIDARGASADLGPLIDDAPGTSEGQPAWPPLTLVADVARVWVDDGLPIDMVRGHATWRDRGLGPSDLYGRVGGTAPVRLIAAEADGLKRIDLTGDDFGGTLRAAGLFDTLTGGRFHFAATRPAGSTVPYEGALEVGAFRLIKAPVAARLLAAAALAGLSDLAAADEGLAFAGLTAPVSFGDGRVRLHPGRAFGPAIGVTWRGDLDLGADTVDVRGTLVPFYAVNRIIGAVPIIGDILTGGRGGGVFAVTYRLSGPLDEPDMAVNPLSILAPGFLRGLFAAPDEGGRWDPADDPAFGEQDRGR